MIHQSSQKDGLGRKTMSSKIYLFGRYKQITFVAERLNAPNIFQEPIPANSSVMSLP